MERGSVLSMVAYGMRQCVEWDSAWTEAACGVRQRVEGDNA